MRGIYFKNGIYVLIDNDTQNDVCIYHYKYKSEVFLYGGRIKIHHKQGYSWDVAFLQIDGISIVRMTPTELIYTLSLETIVSHLNAIEINGVDAFLDNYRKYVEFLYNEVKELNNLTLKQINLENDDSRIRFLIAQLEKIRMLLFSILGVLFSLLSYMKSGLENEKIISIYQSLLDTIA